MLAVAAVVLAFGIGWHLAWHFGAARTAKLIAHIETCSICKDRFITHLERQQNGDYAGEDARHAFVAGLVRGIER